MICFSTTGDILSAESTTEKQKRDLTESPSYGYFILGLVPHAVPVNNFLPEALDYMLVFANGRHEVSAAAA